MLPLEQHAHAIETEEITPLERAGAIDHLRHIHSPGVGSSDERADACPRDDRRLDPELLQRPKNADVREAFQSASAEHERDFVRLASLLGGRRSFQASWSLAGHAKIWWGGVRRGVRRFSAGRYNVLTYTKHPGEID